MSLVLTGLAAAGIALAAPAAADDHSFLATVRVLGFWGSDAAILNNAHWVCNQLAANPGNGYSAHDAAEQLYYQTAIQNEGQAEAFAGLAVTEFCPQYLPGGSSNPTGLGPYET